MTIARDPRRREHSSPVELSARLDRLPMGRFHRGVLLALAVAFVFEFGDLNTFAYVAPALRQHLHLSVAEIAFVTSASFLGMFVGAVVGGRVADRVGRRRALVVSVVFFSASSLLNALVSTVPALAVARLLTGIGLSAMAVAATAYLCEVMPARLRGRMQSAVMAVGLVGIPVMSFAARAIVPLGPDTWRWVFVFGALGLLALPLIARLPESPRWLHRHGRDEQAVAVVERIEQASVADPGALAPLARVSPCGSHAAHGSPGSPGSPGSRGSRGSGVGYRALFRGALGRRTLMLAVVWVFQTLGFYGFVAWVPTLLAAHGFDLVHSLTFSALTTLGAVPGALLAWPLSDRFGRRTPIALMAVGIAACGLAYGLTFAPVAIVVFGFLVNALMQTFAALLYAYTPELFPTELRSSGNGLVYGVGRLSNILGPVIVAAVFGSFGYSPVFVYIAGCWAVVALTIALFGPRTGNQQLENLHNAEPVPAQPVPPSSPIPATLAAS